MNVSTLLEFGHIKKSFGRKEVLSDISFEIKKGEIFGLIGTSGSGKSTLLKILIGLVRPNAGLISFDGKNVLKKINYLRENTGFATQDDLLFDELTIKENSLYFGKLYGIKRKDIKYRLSELLNLLGLSGFENTQISHLSGGMVKRANILVSLIHNPKLLILDEPTVGLDPVLRKSLWKYIHKINGEGTTIFVTSHLLDEIEENCDRIAILKLGKIATLGSLEEYKGSYHNKSLAEIFEEVVKI